MVRLLPHDDDDDSRDDLIFEISLRKWNSLVGKKCVSLAPLSSLLFLKRALEQTNARRSKRALLLSKGVGKRSLLDDGKNVCIHTEHRMEKKSFLFER